MTRLAGFHVEGYGVLSDLCVAELPPGLTVVSGPNEAGKSTLLAFVRGVLFGFPDRRSRLSRHEPLRGGRHGGRVELVDEQGGHWSLARHVGSRGVELLAPDGSPRGELELARLLGGADATLFASVFAFGLDELASFSSLDAEGVRDAVFSAGVLGAGRSAAAAARALRQRRDLLARPRQADATANRLHAELATIEQALRGARHEASSYALRRADKDRLASEVATAREHAEQLRRRLNELERLASCWPVRVRAEAARLDLARIGPPTPRARALIAAEERIARLAGERSGHAERARHREQLATQLAGIERDRDEAEVRLRGVLRPGAPPSGSVAAIAAGEALLERHRDEAALLSAARADWERFSAELAAFEDDERSRQLSARPLERLDELEAVLASLRGELAQLERLLGEEAATAQAERLATLAAGTLRPVGTGAAALLLLVSAILAAGALGLLGTRRPLLAACAGLLALLVLGALALARRDRSPRRQVARAAVDGEAPARRARCEAQAAELAGALGLGSRPDAAVLAAFGARLAGERNERLRLEVRERELERLRAAEHAASRRVAQREQALEQVSSDARALAAASGLEPGVGPEPLAAALRVAGQLEQLQAARRRVLSALAELAASTEAFEGDVLALADELPPASGGSPRPTGGAEAETVLAALGSELRRAVEARELAGKAERTIEECEEELRRQLGTTGVGAALRDRLESGAVLDWEREHEQLAGELELAAREHEAAVAALRDAERGLEELERSGSLAGLELRRSVVTGALDAALEQWAALALAEALLASTLARYERERQPVVVALASALFCEVSDGRYERLVATPGSEGCSPGIEAITARGERVDAASLSRGTAEQMYLCLRLAYASTFAERAVSLPLVLDDVLVNFDPARAAAVARAIAQVASRSQVLAFTCHPATVELLRAAAPSSALVELPAP